MVKDLTPKKKSQKDLILAAIELLKAKDFDINPYTVADEAGIPRSTLYRSTEFMALLKDARNESFTADDTSVDGLQNHIRELEERNKQLEESIWNLEAENEKLAKEKQDAFNEGFVAGRSESEKQLGAVAPAVVPAPPAEQTEFEPAPLEVTVPQVQVPVVENIEAQAEPVTMPTPAPTIDMNQNGQREATTAAVADNVVAISQPAQYGTPTEGVFNVARGGPYANVYNPLVELSWKDVEAVYNFDAMQDMSNQIPDPSAPVAETPTKDLLGGPQVEPHWEDAPGAETSEPPRKTSTEAQEAYRQYAYIESQIGLDHVEGIFSGSESLTESLHDFPADDVLTRFEPEVAPESAGSPPPVTPTWEQPSQVPSMHPYGTDPVNQASNDFRQEASEAYKNWARETAPHDNSQYYAQEQQAYTSQDGLSQQQQDFYGMSNSQSSFANLPTQEEETPRIFVPPKQSYLDLGPEDDEAEAGAQQADELAFQESQNQGYGMSEQEARARGRVTVDRMQAFQDPRDFASSEPVVDLDALDIFDDLDDYVDLDKIDIIRDVDMPEYAGVDEDKTAGDELRELIKGRIKQAADLPGEAGQARSMGAGGGIAAAAADSKANAAGAGATAAGGLGGRSKFVGGKQHSTVESSTANAPPPPPPAGFQPKIPADIRRHALVLGIAPDPEQLTKDKVMQAWKNQIASPGVHPDHGGDTETAVALNTAKDALVRWIDAQSPKLGKKFGGGAGGPGRTGAQPPAT